MPYYPTEQWLEAYGRVLDDSDALDDLAVGWGRGFDGDVRLVVEGLPLEETRLVDLPAELLEEVPERVLDGVDDVALADAPELFGESLRSTLPERAGDLLEQIETNVVDGDIHARIDLEGGACAGVEVLGAGADREAGFVVRGDYAVWRQVVDGRPPASALLSGDFVVEGPLLHRLRYSAMFQLLGELAADVETTHLFESEGGTPADWMLDQAVRQPAFLQRTLERNVSRTLNLFGP
jgi:putative sterol carrier protein